MPKTPARQWKCKSVHSALYVDRDRGETGMQTTASALKLPMLQLLQIPRSFSGSQDALCSPEHSVVSPQTIFLGITYFILFSFAAHKVPCACWYDDLQERRSHAMDLIYYEVKYIIMKNSCSYSSSLQGIPAPLWMTAHTVSSREQMEGKWQHTAPSWRTECLWSGARLIHSSCWRHITEGTEKNIFFATACLDVEQIGLVGTGEQAERRILYYSSL